MRIRCRSTGWILVSLIASGLLALNSFQASARTSNKIAGTLTQQPSTVEPPLPGQTPPPPPPAPNLPPTAPETVVPAVPAAPVAPVTPVVPAAPALPCPPAVVMPAPVFPCPLPVVVPAPIFIDPGPVDPPTPVVTLRVRVQACSFPGQPLEYRICVENQSPADAHHVLVRNPLPANARFVRATPPPTQKDIDLIWVLGTLPACCCKEIILVLEPIGAEEVRNCARVQFEHGQCVTTRIARLAPAAVPVPAPVPGKEPGTTPGPPGTTPGGARGQEPPIPPPPPIPQAPETKIDLRITGPERQLFSQPATYTLTLTNAGGKNATRVLVACILPEKTKYISASEGGKFIEGQVAWRMDTLPLGASKSFQLTIQAESTGKVCLRPFVLADENISVRSEFCTFFFGGSGVLLKMKAVPRNDVGVGQEMSYLVEVENQGNLPVTNIVIRATAPPEMELVKSKSPNLDSKLAEPNKRVGGTVIFQPFANLQPGGLIRYEIFVKALQPGTVVFEVQMNADQLKGGPVREQESTRILTDQEMSRRRARTTSYRPEKTNPPDPARALP